MILKILCKTIVLFGLWALINACGTGDEIGDSFDPAFYNYEMVHVESTYQGCAAGNDNCTYMTFDYPKFKNSDNSEVLKKIGRKIKRLMLYASEAESPESVCKNFIEDYKNFVDDPETENYGTAWFDKRKVSWLSIEKKVLSVECRLSSFMGGAHSNSFVMLRNFNPYTGDSLGLGMVFVPESLYELTRIGELQFQKSQKLKKGDSYEEAGYWFKDNQFYLTGNFAFTKEGLLFYYNEYEIAPYSMGAIYFVVPYSLIMHLFE